MANGEMPQGGKAFLVGVTQEAQTRGRKGMRGGGSGGTYLSFGVPSKSGEQKKPA